VRTAVFLGLFLAGCATTPVAEVKAVDDGELTQAEIRSTIQAHLDALQDCSNRYQRLRPGSHGKLTVAFHVQPGGETSDVSARGEAAPELAACAREVFLMMRFPPHAGDPELVLWPMKY
jgi:hypothetical protein